MLLDNEKFEAALKDASNRAHNLPDLEKRELVGDAIGEWFDAATAKVADYRHGNEIVEKGGYFNTLSLGNWLSVADAVGVKSIPSRFIGSCPSLAFFSDAMGNERKGDWMVSLEAFDAATQDIREDEMLRFDGCASSYVKSKISEGDPKINDECRGWVRQEDGTIGHIVCERLVDSFLNTPQEITPAFARKIVSPKLRDGWSVTTGRAGKWPVEWRVYVKNGLISGVSNYYPQSPAQEEDIGSAAKAAEETVRLILGLREMGGIPHHPRYEGEFDDDKLTFTADFMLLDDGTTTLIECGPGHIYSPAWGAHPCCFDPRKGIDGLAMAQGDIRPLSDLHPTQ